MVEKGIESVRNHRVAADAAVLFRPFGRAGALAAAGRDKDNGNPVFGCGWLHGLSTIRQSMGKPAQSAPAASPRRHVADEAIACNPNIV
jgi:hypothetical protein